MCSFLNIQKVNTPMYLPPTVTRSGILAALQTIPLCLHCIKILPVKGTYYPVFLIYFFFLSYFLPSFPATQVDQCLMQTHTHFWLNQKIEWAKMNLRNSHVYRQFISFWVETWGHGIKMWRICCFNIWIGEGEIQFDYLKNPLANE